MDANAMVLRLKSIPIFANVDEDFLREVESQCRYQTFEPSMPLFYEGQEAPGLHVILAGEVALERALGRGESLVFAVRRAGECIGEISLLDHRPASATARAKTAVRAAIIRPSEFHRILSRSPSSALVLLTTVATRLRETTEQFTYAQSHSLTQRLADLLLREAADDGCVTIDSQRALGERIGGSREAVNRALKELCTRGGLTPAGKRNSYRIKRERLSELAR